MSEPPSRLRIAVVIATCDRLGLLRDRALQSVRAQTRTPDFLVVVDDSTDGQRHAVRDLLHDLALPGCRIAYVENARSAGASGSWNTGLDVVLGESGAPEATFVAILDDDDSWAPHYLERCLDLAENNHLDMVASGLRRIESDTTAPLVGEAPETLRAEDFLTGNPGIQGSSLFVRLSVLLAAGGFDEGLRSTTDRDLCIRIAELGTVRYGPVSGALVDHYADADRARLSTRGSVAKLEGLTAFWRKYVGRMTADQRQAFQDRAEMLFGWCPPSDMPVVLPPDEAPRKALVLGLFANSDHPDELLDAVHMIADLRDDNLVGLDIVLLERGPRTGARAVIEEATALLRDSGAGCFRVSPDHEDDELGRALLALPDLPAGPSTAESHLRLLRVCSAWVASSRTGSEVWLAAGSERNERVPRGARAMDVLGWLGAASVDGRQLAGAHVEQATVLRGAGGHLARDAHRRARAPRGHGGGARPALGRLRPDAFPPGLLLPRRPVPDVRASEPEERVLRLPGTTQALRHVEGIEPLLTGAQRRPPPRARRREEHRLAPALSLWWSAPGHDVRRSLSLAHGRAATDKQARCSEESDIANRREVDP